MTDWNATLYDNKHKFVSNFGEDLVSFLNPQKGERILDVGCGTGDLAHTISKSGATVTGIDAAQSMIEAAKEKYPDIHFSVQDGEQFSFDPQFHVVFSNAAIHWMKNQQKVVQNCYDVLLPSGRFVAELGGANNIQSIVDAIEEASDRLSILYDATLFPWVFPTKEEMKEHLINAGFNVTTIEHYERPTPLVGEDGIRNWLEMFSNNMFKNLTNDEKEAIYSECERILRPQLYKENGWVADYWRLRFIAQKP
ncbi:class I SAM-dependent methyltransferase [Metabacillus rhizolycopersici]|uniref:Methyltransferase domain-containing protein n=1 Tax=Metabacillus rhizolycopersici TaxID=2875709 RepID=A0ABS7UZW1_9BACI|nr:class I SAM-dependent methyltransferase [Metabacillus rhizolycopersici]MBZ5753799.1 methyltransferase domain-containing protein [Metabacillus rhizolycopersici]